jgi:subfamily B ATP-binding cassette protein MsbA
MDKGQIVEKGIHADLLKKETGYYKKLYDAQFVTDENA